MSEIENSIIYYGVVAKDTVFNFRASKKQGPIKPHSPAGDFLPRQKTFRVWWPHCFFDLLCPVISPKD